MRHQLATLSSTHAIWRLVSAFILLEDALRPDLHLRERLPYKAAFLAGTAFLR